MKITSAQTELLAALEANTGHLTMSQIEDRGFKMTTVGALVRHGRAKIVGSVVYAAPLSRLTGWSEPKKPNLKSINDGLGKLMARRGVYAEEVRAQLELASCNSAEAIEAAMGGLNATLHGFGVVSLENRRLHGEAAALYIDLGDPGDTTILYDAERNEFLITQWGDWLAEAEFAGTRFVGR